MTAGVSEVHVTVAKVAVVGKDRLEVNSLFGVGATKRSTEMASFSASVGSVAAATTSS